MQNARLDEAQADIKIAGRNINNLKYADDTTLMAESKEELKSQTQLSDLPFTFHFHALEKEMATHSGVLAWRIPETGEPSGLPSMGSHD